jgi:hypothetical protein
MELSRMAFGATPIATKNGDPQADNHDRLQAIHAVPLVLPIDSRSLTCRGKKGISSSRYLPVYIYSRLRNGSLLERSIPSSSAVHAGLFVIRRWSGPGAHIDMFRLEIISHTKKNFFPDT